MKRIHITILKAIVGTIVIVSCANGNTSLSAEKLFSDMYPNCEMNKLLKMIFVGKLYEGDRSINFSLEPSTNTSVIFPSGYNIKLISFDTEQDKWIKVKNNVQYFPEDAKYIIGKNDPTKEHTYSLIGIHPTYGKKIDIRIVLHGNIYENGIETDRCTGAFIDFEFIP